MYFSNPQCFTSPVKLALIRLKCPLRHAQGKLEAGLEPFGVHEWSWFLLKVQTLSSFPSSQNHCKC